MRRNLSPPNNPDLLGRVIAALRVYTGARKPRNATERRIDGALQAQKIRKTTAGRMLKSLDAVPQRARSVNLGRIANPAFVPSARPPELVVAPSTIAVPTTVFRSGAGDILRDSGPGEVTDVQGEGPRPQPVYTIRYKGLWCQGETTWDRFSNSDEVYVVTSAVHISDGQNPVRTERHPLAAAKTHYEGVDTAEERIGPVAACWFGNSDPVSLTTVVFEHDEGDPNAYKDEVDALVKAAIAVASILYPPAKWLGLLSGVIADAVNWLLDTGDDPIETQTLVLPRDLLEWYAGHWEAPFIGYRVNFSLSGGSLDGATVQPVVTNLQQHFVTTHSGGGATYVVGFDVIRDPEIPKETILL